MSTWGFTRRGASESATRYGRLPERPERDRERDRDRERARQVCQAAIPEIHRALSLLPTTDCVMTSAFENRKSGLLISRVMSAADHPACVCVAVPAGHRLATLIRDSHAFALCAVERGSRLLAKKFGPEETPDAFDMMETRTLVSASPILCRSIMALDCEVLRHLDLEADHEIYVGQVLSAFVRGAPADQAGAVVANGHAPHPS